MDAKHKKLLRERKELKKESQQQTTSQSKHQTTKTHSASSDDLELSEFAKNSKVHTFFDKHYKHLLIVTFLITLSCLAVILHSYVTTGEVFNKGVSLSGGITFTVSTQDKPVDIIQIEELLRKTHPKNDLAIREISDFGTQRGFSIEASTALGEKQTLPELSKAITNTLRTSIPDIDKRISIEETGPSLGASFFEQTIKAVLIAFVCMGLVVFLYFGDTYLQKAIVILMSFAEMMLIWYANNWLISIIAIIMGILLFIAYIKYSIPSTAVIIAAASTIIFTIAVVDLIGMRISTAGIAAFLMLIGYSVDTDILLSTRVLKNTAGTVYDRTMSTLGTGLTMTGATFAAAFISYLFTQSEVIKEIMLIICIGLVADIYNTWIQNAGILRWHLESKGKK